MGMSCMSFIHPYPGPALHWKNTATLCQYLVQGVKHVQPVAEGQKTSQDKMRIVGRQRERGEEGNPGRGCCHGPTLLCLMSLQQFGKVLKFTSFYWFYCLPSLYFFLNGFKRKKDFFSYIGATFFAYKKYLMALWWMSSTVNKTVA